MGDRPAPIARSPLSALIAESTSESMSRSANQTTSETAGSPASKSSGRAAPVDSTLLAEIPLLRYIVLRGDSNDSDFVQRVHDVLALSPPTAPCSFSRDDNGALLWLSPDEWMFIGRRDDAARTGPSLQHALDGIHAQATDVSGGYTLLRLSGPASILTLRHLGSYDFDTLMPGRAVGTMLSSAQVFVFRIDAGALYVVVRRSLAEYVWTLLLKAGKPYGIAASAALPAPDPWAIIGPDHPPKVAQPQ